MADKTVLAILEEHYGKVKVKGNYAYINSPFNTSDKTPSCAVVLEASEKFSEGFFKDFSSGKSGNIFSLLNIPHDFGLKNRGIKLPSLNSPAVVRHHMTKFEYNSSLYLFNRGISYEVQEYFKVFEMDGQVAMPVFDKDGYFIYNVSRLTTKKGYANSSPTDAYPAFTHELKTSDTVFVCESMIDAFTFFTNGLKAVALNGAGNHSGLKEIFKSHFGRIVLCLDSDEIGQTNAHLIKNALVDKDVINIVLPLKDVNEVWVEMLKELGVDTARVVFLKLIERKINNKMCPCTDCQKETKNTRDYFMVRDEVWLSAVPEENHCGVIFLCRDCLAKRLGRPLEESDFIEHEINNYSNLTE